jgi:hypothetical protein
VFISVGALFTRTAEGVTVELTTDDGHRGGADIHAAHLSCVGSMYHASIVLRPPPENKPTHTKRRRKQVSRKQEEGLAQSHGGERHYGSGNKPGYEGDVRVRGKYRIEAKFRTSKSYPVKRAELDKIRSECGLGEVPVFVIDFKNPETLRTEDSWVLVPRTEWEKHVGPTTDD